MLKVCQIATVGENIEWIIKGLLLFKADKLLLISTSDPNFLEKIKEIKERLLDPKFERPPLDIEEIIIESADPLEFISTFKKIVIENFNQSYEIEINATAGLRVWQLLGYFTKIQLNNIISKYFIINKQSGEPIIFPPSILSNTEQILVDIIGDKRKNIERIKKDYEEIKNRSVSTALISKYLTKLREKRVLLETKTGKLKYFQLSRLGKIYSIDPKRFN